MLSITAFEIFQDGLGKTSINGGHVSGLGPNNVVGLYQMCGKICWVEMTYFLPMHHTELSTESLN
jgi:hypothetical protein